MQHKTTKTIEKYDSLGYLVERTVETTVTEYTPTAKTTIFPYPIPTVIPSGQQLQPSTVSGIPDVSIYNPNTSDVK